MVHGEQYTPTHSRPFGRLDRRWGDGGRSAFFLAIISKTAGTIFVRTYGQRRIEVVEKNNSPFI